MRKRGWQDFGGSGRVVYCHCIVRFLQFVVRLLKFLDFSLVPNDKKGCAINCGVNF